MVIEIILQKPISARTPWVSSRWPVEALADAAVGDQQVGGGITLWDGGFGDVGCYVGPGLDARFVDADDVASISEVGKLDGGRKGGAKGGGDGEDG